ncbi:hypothetical protein TSUD_334720 [Trifolium subterraneum]|uniref:VHS domain-containing protein n=1 Tax=Trifolium subterraneum TaxID=3900 RepID=A0A2Z6MCZ8_TRISU|nr:hypothetical protein TSUD_334720 [Trifolium subterraneum]
MDKSKLALFGERLKTSSANMSRIVSGKMKEILQTPTPESKMVDEATSETLEEPNWGMNLRICGLINADEFNGSEVVKTIKRKINHKSPIVQKHSLDLLETCAMNCEKVFSEIASEKLLDDMVRLIENNQADQENRRRAFQLIRAWGESEDIAYLPVFSQTYMVVNSGLWPVAALSHQSGAVRWLVLTASCLVVQFTIAATTVPVDKDMLFQLDRHILASNTWVSGYLFSFTVSAAVSLKGRGETLDTAGGNSPPIPYASESHALDPPERYPVPEAGLHALSLDDPAAFFTDHVPASVEEKKEHLVEDLTLTLLDKCKQSLSVIKDIVESTTNDEETLFEALYLNDELQQLVDGHVETKIVDSAKVDGHVETKIVDSTKEQNGEPSLLKSNTE